MAADMQHEMPPSFFSSIAHSAPIVLKEMQTAQLGSASFSSHKQLLSLACAAIKLSRSWERASSASVMALNNNRYSFEIFIMDRPFFPPYSTGTAKCGNVRVYLTQNTGHILSESVDGPENRKKGRINDEDPFF